MLHRAMNANLNKVIVDLFRVLIYAPFVCAATFQEVYYCIMLAADGIVHLMVPPVP